MRNKPIVKLISLLLVFVFCQTTFAYEACLPGITEYTLNGDVINLSSDGDVTFDYYMPFDAESMDITYTSSNDVNLSFETDDGTENVALASQNAGVSSYVFETVVRKGEKTVKISANNEISIESIIFNKKKVKTSETQMTVCSLSDNEDAIKTAVIIDLSASMLMVNGARRYIDNSDVTKLCENINGSIYLPLHTLARALGYYYEDIPEKNYVLLRKESKEFGFKNSVGYEEEYLFDKKDIKNPIKYINGKAYAPVRYFAEVIGKIVCYKDGIVVIDDKYSVEKICNNEEIFSYVKNLFKDFYPDEVTGKKYYVAKTPNASDKNDGRSINTPFLTLNRAGEEAEAGDTVIVCEGVYRESLSVKNNGTQTKPITFIAKEGDKVVISATREVSGFSWSGNALKAPVSWDLGDGRNQVFLNNESLIEARYPNVPGIDTGSEDVLSDNWPILADLKVDTEDTLLVTSDALLNQDEVDYWKDAYFVTCRGSGYRLTTARVASSKKGSLTLTDTTKVFWNKSQINLWNYGYLAGHINCLDEIGEWVLKDGELYVIPPEGTDADTFTVEMKARQTVLDLSDNEYVHIKNIDMFGGGIKMNNSEMCMLDGCEIKYNNHFILSQDQANGYIDDADTTNTNGAPQRGEVGIYVGGRDNIFINNTIKEAAGAAIYATGAYMYIENNLIDGCGYAGSYVAGLTFMPGPNEALDKVRGGHSIYSNTVCNSGRATMLFAKMENKPYAAYLPSEIAYNDFHDGMLTTLDTGITYEYYVLMGDEKLKTKYHNNYVYYTMPKSHPYSKGIYHDGGTQNIETYDNVVFTTNNTTLGQNIFTQTAEHAYAACDTWNNTIHLSPVLDGVGGLKTEDYPYERPFFAGVKNEDKEFLLNYNKISAEYDAKHIYAKSATLTRCTVEDDNSVSFNDDGYLSNKITFEDVDFGENGANRLLIDFYGDKYNTGDTVTLTIGNKSYTIKLEAKSESNNQINTFIASINKVFGENDVSIRGSEILSARIVSIMPYLQTFNPGELNSARIYGGTYTDYVAGKQDIQPRRVFGAMDDAENPYVNSTYQGTVLEYKNVTFEDAVSSFGISASSTSGNSGQTLKVHLDSPDNEAVGEIVIPKTADWSEYVESNAQLTSAIPAGEHDIYITFTGKGTCNLYYIELK